MNDLIRDNEDKNILIELNTISTAKECYDTIDSDNHHIHFLSSQIISKHRKPRIGQIKEGLEPDSLKPIILVTTQVIEAGVDFDFHIAVRDIRPIDSIVQTAGRCNRYGIRDANESPFFIYRIIDDKRPDSIIIEHARYVYGDVSIEIANSMLKPYKEDKLDIIHLVGDYYNEIKRCESNQQSSKINTHISELNYEEVEKEFQLIDQAYKMPVYVEFDDNAKATWERFVNLEQSDKKDKIRGENEQMKVFN